MNVLHWLSLSTTSKKLAVIGSRMAQCPAPDRDMAQLLYIVQSGGSGEREEQSVEMGGVCRLWTLQEAVEVVGDTGCGIQWDPDDAMKRSLHLAS